MTVRVRFAPSPTGELHVGNVRTALHNWLFARQQGGVFILRIEDTDIERSRREYETEMLKDLRWFGLDWDEGPDVGGDCGPYRQSERLEIYRAFAHRLLGEGLAYRCFCTDEALDREREQAKVEARPYKYSGRCKNLSEEEVEEKVRRGIPFVLRLKVRPGKISWEDVVRGHVEWRAEVIGDFVIMKSDGWPVYNFACVVDDILMRISHVIRGDGHLPNTPRQILIYEALGAQPPVFAHLSTILGSDGAKLSKRHGAVSLSEFRERGYLPEALFNLLALLGWSPPEGYPEVLTKDQLCTLFSFDRVSKAPAIFDLKKLNWMNRAYLKSAPPEFVLEAAIPYLRKAGRLNLQDDEQTRAWLRTVIEAVFTHLDCLSQDVEETRVIFEYDLSLASQYAEVQELLRDPEGLAVIRFLGEELSSTDGVTLETFKKAVARVKERTGRKGKALLHPIRIALTGQPSGPELDRLVPIYEMGSQLALPQPILSVRERIEAFLEWARKQADQFD